MIIRGETLRVMDEIEASCRADGRTHLTEWETYAIVRQWQIPVAVGMLVQSPDEAAAAAAVIGGTVAVKVVSPDIPHKTEVGGIRLGLSGGARVAGETADLLICIRRKLPDARIHGVLIQQMAPKGVELIASGMQDPSFGPVVMAGLGGIFTEVMKDVVFRLAPITVPDAMEMLAELKGSALLSGVRGSQPVDRAALAQLMVNLSRLVAAWPSLREIELNPLIAWEGGVVAVDALAGLNE